MFESRPKVEKHFLRWVIAFRSICWHLKRYMFSIRTICELRLNFSNNLTFAKVIFSSHWITCRVVRFCTQVLSCCKDENRWFIERSLKYIQNESIERERERTISIVDLWWLINRHNNSQQKKHTIKFTDNITIYQTIWSKNQLIRKEESSSQNTHVAMKIKSNYIAPKLVLLFAQYKNIDIHVRKKYKRDVYFVYCQSHL